ncbi:MAG: acylneuraminate cytidylyltransferase family protein [Blastocatellales bacterium]
MRVLGLIPARGGSKGVPRKNIKLLCGRPLLAYTADAAFASRRLSRVILSTEDEEIAEVARSCGLEIPFLRPVELGRDETPMLPVVQHAVRFLEERGDHFDAICLLQPTNPVRTADDIDGCIQLLESNDADAVVTVLPVPAEHNPHWVYFRDDQGRLRLSTSEAAPIPRRQELPPAFHREGSVYVTRRETLMERNSFYGARLLGYEMNAERSVNIDDHEDWLRAEGLIAEGRRQKAVDSRQ